MRSSFVRRAASLVLMCCVGCEPREHRTSAAPGASPPPESSLARVERPGSPLPLATYPAGRWRLAAPAELDETRLWMSHILIRHRLVPAHLVSLSALNWEAAPLPPDRSREEAFELATKVARLARETPKAFAQLAETYSEDVTTRREGGSLGGIGAGQLVRWPEVLDAAAALGHGEVSHPVETAYGFHVFLRRAPPAEGTYSGSRIVVGYDTAPWLHDVLARGPVPARSRAAALALAQSVYERAASAPHLFDQLVQQYSEHRDAVRSGDFGEWSTNQQTPFPLAVERLSQLQVGQISPPLDSPFGFQIIRRTPDRPRVTYAAQRIQIAHDARLPPEAPDSAAGVLRRLQRIADEVQRQPKRFEAYQRETCCVRTSVWQEGHGSALEEQVLARLRIGEIARMPLRVDGKRHALLKRVEPGDWSPQRVRFELPAPGKPSLEQFVAYARGAQIAALGQLVATDLGLDGAEAKQLTSAHAVEQQFDASRSRKARWRLFLEVRRKVESLLGPERFAAYLASVDRRVEHELLEGARVRTSRMAAPRVVR